MTPTPDDSVPATSFSEAQPTAEQVRADRRRGKRCAEIGGRDGPEPTRFGDWELRGRCIDF